MRRILAVSKATVPRWCGGKWCIARQSWAAFTDDRKKYPNQFIAWFNQTNRKDNSTANPADFAGVDIATTDWTSIPLPGKVAGAGLPPAGTFWLRKDVTLRPLGRIAWWPDSTLLVAVSFPSTNAAPYIYSLEGKEVGRFGDKSNALQFFNYKGNGVGLFLAAG